MIYICDERFKFTSLFIYLSVSSNSRFILSSFFPMVCTNNNNKNNNNTKVVVYALFLWHNKHKNFSLSNSKERKEFSVCLFVLPYFIFIFIFKQKKKKFSFLYISFSCLDWRNAATTAKLNYNQEVSQSIEKRNLKKHKYETKI